MYGAQIVTTLAPLIPPSELTTPGLNFTTPRAGPKISRYPRLLQPNDQTYSTPTGNGIIRFRLPNDGVYNFKDSMLFWDVTITQTPNGVNPYLALMNGTWNMIERVRLIQQGQVIQERLDYAKVFNLKMGFLSDPTYLSKMGPLFGMDTFNNRKANATVTSRYAVPLDLGFLTAGPIPLNSLNGAIDLEITLSQVQDCLDTNGSSNLITVSNIEWYVERIAGAAWETSWAQRFISGGMKIAFKEWILFQNPVFQYQHDLKIGVRRASLDMVISYFTNLDTLRNTDIITTGFPDRQFNCQKLDLLNYQFRINGEVYPDQAVDCTGDAERAYKFYLGWSQGWMLDAMSQKRTPCVDPVAFNGTDSTHGQFIVVGDFRSNRNEWLFDQSIINMLGTEAAAQDLQLNVRFGTNPPTGSAMMHYTQFSCIASVNQSGTVIVNF